MSSSKALIEQRRQKKNRQKMLTILILGGVLIIAAGSALGITTWKNRANPDLVTVTGQPSIEVDQELIDFGNVKFDTPKTFVLSLTNVGDKPLIISEKPYVEVREGC